MTSSHTLPITASVSAKATIPSPFNNGLPPYSLYILHFLTILSYSFPLYLSITLFLLFLVCNSVIIFSYSNDVKPLLPKIILAPKCISPIPPSLSPVVNLRLYHHSAETETHIHFSSKIAETFDLLGFS